jgi:hypothetical protein
MAVVAFGENGDAVDTRAFHGAGEFPSIELRGDVTDFRTSVEIEMNLSRR